MHYFAPVMSLDATCREVGALGQLMDAADCRQLALSPKIYLTAAVRARNLLNEQMGNPHMLAVCSQYESLAELLGALRFERAAENGNSSATFDFTPFTSARP